MTTTPTQVPNYENPNGYRAILLAMEEATTGEVASFREPQQLGFVALVSGVTDAAAKVSIKASQDGSHFVELFQLTPAAGTEASEGMVAHSYLNPFRYIRADVLELSTDAAVTVWV